MGGAVSVGYAPTRARVQELEAENTRLHMRLRDREGEVKQLTTQMAKLRAGESACMRALITGELASRARWVCCVTGCLVARCWRAETHKCMRPTKGERSDHDAPVLGARRLWSHAH